MAIKTQNHHLETSALKQGLDIAYLYQNYLSKIVLRHEAINAWRDLKRKEEREISLDYLMSEKYFEPSAMDSYFEKQDKPTVFLVFGKEVIVDNERLATALLKLPKLRHINDDT